MGPAVGTGPSQYWREPYHGWYGPSQACSRTPSKGPLSTAAGNVMTAMGPWALSLSGMIWYLPDLAWALSYI